MPIHKLETHQADIHYFMLSREVVQAIDNPDALAIKAMRCLRVAGLYRVVRLKDDKSRFCSNEFHIYPFSYLRVSVQSEMNTDIKEKEIPKEKESISSEERQLFEDFRQRYGGKKRGLDTELNNFLKKTKDWKTVLPMLSTVNLDFDVTDKKYIPHFQTFINQRKWEMMVLDPKSKAPIYQEFNWRKK